MMRKRKGTAKEYWKRKILQMAEGKRCGWRLALAFGLCICSCILTGCHGSKGLQTFEVPEKFEENQKYEITFWAKNDTNKTH